MSDALPCPICGGVEGCDHTVSERLRAENARLQEWLESQRLAAVRFEGECETLRTHNAKLRELKTPATRQLLNVTKGLLDHAEAECTRLRAVLQEIWELTDVDSNTVPSAARLSAIVRAALNEETK